MKASKEFKPITSRQRRTLRCRQYRDTVSALKAARRCLICGEGDPRCLDFHHRDPKTKTFTISAGGGKSTQKLLDEVSKCEVLCANCHRKIPHPPYRKTEDGI